MNQEGMNQILTDEEITLIIRECARGSAINRDGSTSHRIARAIEQAVLNKLGEQEPVAWLHQTRTSSDVITDEVKMFLLRQYERWEFHSSMQRPSVCKAENYTKPLYLHPAPSVPEGYQLVPIEPTDAMQEAWDGESSLMGTWNAMLSAAKKQIKDGIHLLKERLKEIKVQ